MKEVVIVINQRRGLCSEHTVLHCGRNCLYCQSTFISGSAEPGYSNNAGILRES